MSFRTTFNNTLNLHFNS